MSGTLVGVILQIKKLQFLKSKKKNLKYFSADFLNEITTPEISSLNKIVNFSILFIVHQNHSNNYLN